MYEAIVNYFALTAQDKKKYFEGPLQIISECWDFMARKKKCRKSPSDYSHNVAHNAAVISRPKKEKYFVNPSNCFQNITVIYISQPTTKTRKKRKQPHR